MIPDLRLPVLIIAFTVAAGLLDALAFMHSAEMWRNGKLVWNHAIRAGMSFALGISMYWGAVRYLEEAGVVLAEIQTLIWFGVTVIGVTVLSGRFTEWPLLEQIVAVNVLIGLGWLITRTSV